MNYDRIARRGTWASRPTVHFYQVQYSLIFARKNGGPIIENLAITGEGSTPEEAKADFEKELAREANRPFVKSTYTRIPQPFLPIQMGKTYVSRDGLHTYLIDREPTQEEFNQFGDMLHGTELNGRDHDYRWFHRSNGHTSPGIWEAHGAARCDLVREA